MTAFSLRDVVTDILLNMKASMVDLVPRIFTATIVILIGYLIAKIVQRALRTILTRLKFDTLLEKIGITGTFKKMGAHGSPAAGVAKTVYFLIFVMFIQSATKSVGLGVISDAIGAFFAYLPNLFAAIVIIILGNTVAEFGSQAVRRSAEESGIDYAETLGRVVSALIFFVVAIMAVTQLRIETDIIKSVAIVMLSGLALGGALSFGLGSRDLTRNIMAGFYARKLYTSGDAIQFGKERGTLIAITPVQTLIEQGEETVSIPNSVFLEQVVRH